MNEHLLKRDGANYGEDAQKPVAWPYSLPATWLGEGWIDLSAGGCNLTNSELPFYCASESVLPVYRRADTFWRSSAGRLVMVGAIVRDRLDFAWLNEALGATEGDVTLWLSASAFRAVGRITSPERVATAVLRNASDISDLAPLTHLGELKALFVECGSPRDLLPLRDLPKLEAVYFDHIRCPTDATALWGIETLRHLDLRHGEWVEIRECARLAKLISLGLHGSVTDGEVEAIAKGCRDLRRLACASTYKLTTVRPIASLHKLETLEISGTHMDDFRALRALRKLKSLDLSANDRLTNLEPLVWLPNLERVMLWGCDRLRDFSALSHMPRLISLSMPEHAADGDLRAVLSACPQLERLDLGSGDEVLNADAIATSHTLRDLRAWRPICNIASLRALGRLKSAALRVPEDAHDLSFFAPSASIRQLSLSFSAADASFVPLDSMRDAQTLEISWCTVDAQSLVGFKNLAELCISDCTNLINIDALGELPSLTCVSLRNTPVGRIWAMERNKYLVALDLSGTRVSDLSPLRSANELRELNLARCNHSVDLTVLGALANLTDLVLSESTTHRELSPLTRAHRLARLGLDSCAWVRDSDLKAVSQIKGLVKLELGWNENITAISPLTGLRSLEDLDLIGCTAVTDIQPLAKLRELRTLSLSGCEGISDFSPVRKMTNLVELLLEATNARDISFVRQLPNLRYIDLTMSHDVEDITPLVGLRAKGCVVQFAERYDELVELDARAGKIP